MFSSSRGGVVLFTGLMKFSTVRSPGDDARLRVPPKKSPARKNTHERNRSKKKAHGHTIRPAHRPNGT